ncbi:hypothetical protein AB1N83_009536 [Pleurotus pulmonarius]
MNFPLKPEALGMPADKGHGWAQLEFGEAIRGNQCYTIVRKLGWGMYSSTWMARDKAFNKYVATKALTPPKWIAFPHERGIVHNSTTSHLFFLTSAAPNLLNFMIIAESPIEYFQPENCYLKKEPNIFYFTMGDNIAQYKQLPDDELRPASDFLRRCLRLNPEERVAAKDLHDRWLQGVD